MNETRYSLVNLVRVAHSFPVTPRIMARLEPLLRDPDPGLGEIAALLRHDSALSARLLRIANSAVFAPAEPVASIEEAAALIGLQEIHRLVGAVAVDAFSQRHYPVYGVTGPRVRDNALLTALLAEELAVPAREDPAAAYAAGLFRSLGKLALARIADEHAPVAPFRLADAASLAVWEKLTFGLASNRATAAILREWRFPEPVAEAIDGHYTPAAPGRPLASLLHLAAHLAEQQGHGLPCESGGWLDGAEVARTCGVGPRPLEHAIERATRAFDRINRALG